MTMDYCLRVNHDAPDHGPLILGAIRPALAEVRALAGPIGAALRPHWQDGPHVLVGLDTSGTDAPEAAWSVLETGIARWLALAPPPEPIDPDAYHRKSLTFAEFEQIPYERRPLRPANSVERGAFQVPPPVGTPALAPIRDAFKAASLDTVFDLVETRLASPPRALLDYILLILCLDRVEWRGGLSLWPLSLRGQALVGAHAFARAEEAFPAMADRLEAPFLALVRDERLLEPEAALPAHRRQWLATLQDTYRRLLEFVDAADPAYFEAISEAMLAAPAAHNEAMGLSAERAAAIMSSPTHFAYRMLVNFIYEMLPAIGFPPSRRLFACYFVTRMLDRHFPAVMERARHAGSTI